MKFRLKTVCAAFIRRAKNILILLLCLSGYHSQAQTDTISLVIAPMDSNVGMCLENRFSATFLASGQHFFTIQAELLRDTVVDTEYNCSDSILALPYFQVAFHGIISSFPIRRSPPVFLQQYLPIPSLLKDYLP